MDSNVGSTDDAGITQGPKPSSGLKARWKALPGPIRKSVVLTIGLTLVAVGAVLIVLPGPFTLPFMIAGVAVLASEFAWAATLMDKGKAGGVVAKEWAGKVPLPALVAIIVFVVAAVASITWWIFVR